MISSFLARRRVTLSLAAATCLIALVTGGVSAQQGALIRLSPTAATVGEGKRTAVEVRVESVEDLYALDIQLAFDPAVVQVVDADPGRAGVQIQPGELLSLDLVAKNTADNDEGTVWFAMTQLNPSEPVSGDGLAFSVIFRGREPGATSPIAITHGQLVTRDGEEIATTTQDGTIEVVAPEQAPPEPTEAPTRRPTVELPTATPSPAGEATTPPTATSTTPPPAETPPSPTSTASSTGAAESSPTPEPPATDVQQGADQSGQPSETPTGGESTELGGGTATARQASPSPPPAATERPSTATEEADQVARAEDPASQDRNSGTTTDTRGVSRTVLIGAIVLAAAGVGLLLFGVFRLLGRPEDPHGQSEQ